MKKQIGAGITIISLLILLVASTSAVKQKQSLTSQAHELETGKKTVGALLHVDPNDAPVAQQVATLTFTVKDMTNRFTSEQCTCTLVISSGTAEIYKKAIAGTKDKLISQFTFTTPGAFTLTLSGEPKVEGAFDDFSLTYNVEVSGASQKAAPRASANQPGISPGTVPGSIKNKLDLFENPLVVLGPIVLLTILGSLFFAFRKRNH